MNLLPLTDPARDLRLQVDEITAPHREALWAFCLRLTGNVCKAVGEELGVPVATRSYWYEPART